MQRLGAAGVRVPAPLRLSRSTSRPYSSVRRLKVRLPTGSLCEVSGRSSPFKLAACCCAPAPAAQRLVPCTMHCCAAAGARQQLQAPCCRRRPTSNGRRLLVGELGAGAARPCSPPPRPSTPLHPPLPCTPPAPLLQRALTVRADSGKYGKYGLGQQLEPEWLSPGRSLGSGSFGECYKVRGRAGLQAGL